MKSRSQKTKDNQANSQKYLAYLLDCIDGDGYDVELKTNEDKVRFLFKTFKSEYGWAIERYGLSKAFEEWLKGLPSSFNIEWTNHNILQLAVKMGSLPEGYTEKQADKILENYWEFITNKTFRLFRAYKLI